MSSARSQRIVRFANDALLLFFLAIVIMKQAHLPIGPVTNLSIRLNSTLTDEATLLQLLLAGANC